MQKVHQERKRELIASFVDLLHHLQLDQTAQVLTEESALAREKNVEEDVNQILREGRMSERERRTAVENYCKYSIQNYLREGRVDEALQVYEVIVPLHCPQKIAEFSLLFAQTQKGAQKGVALLLQSFLQRPNVLPESRISCLKVQHQIWFMHLLACNRILLVDCFSNAFIVSGNEIQHRKEKTHNEPVSAVAVCPSGEVFATGSRDKTVKAWSYSLILLHVVDVHKAKINAVLFFDRSLIIFDLESVLSVHQLDPSSRPALDPPSRLALKCAFKTPSPFVDAKYAKSKRKILGVSNQAGGRISYVNLEKKRVEKVIQTEKRIFAIEVSLDEKMVFANVASGEIHAFSLSGAHELLYRLTGFVQVKNLMRMCQGGREGQYLAVSSEEGTVRIYVIKEEYEVVKLIGESKKSVNCVAWKDEQLYFACDGGSLECWASDPVPNPTNGTNGVHKQM